MKKILLFSISLFFLGNYLFAQVAGDFLSTATGAWNSPSNWRKHDGTDYQITTEYPGQNPGTGTVTIKDGTSIGLNVSPANAIGSLIIQGGIEYSDLFIADGFILNVTGAVEIRATDLLGTAYKQIGLIGVNAQLNCASLTIVESENPLNISHLTFNDGGIVNVTGNINMGSDIPRRALIEFSGGGGILNIGGNIVGGSIKPGFGTIKFNGNGVQTIGGSQPVELHTVEIINPASTLQLDGNVTMHGTLTLTAGKINTGVNILTLDNGTPASQVVGGNSISYIYSTGVGRLRRVGLPSGGTYGFPVGIPTAFLPLTISPAAGTSTFEVKVFSPASTDGVEGGPAFVDKSKIVDAVWNIDRPSGSGDVSITFQWTDALEGATFSGFGNSQIGVSRYSGGWLPAVADNALASVNWVQATFNAFSPFGVGEISVALPVTFGSFEAYEKQKGVQLDWKVYTEDKVKNYEVERSADAVTFTVIGSLPALYNNGTGGDYNFFDGDPLRGTSFYRIKNVDIDGKSAYSPIRRVNRDVSVKEFNLYPNPALNSIISLQGSFLAKGNYKLSVVSINGQEIYSKTINHIGGTISQTIELPAKIGKGVYLVTIKDEKGNYIFSERLVKK